MERSKNGEGQSPARHLLHSRDDDIFPYDTLLIYFMYANKSAFLREKSARQIQERKRKVLLACMAMS